MFWLLAILAYLLGSLSFAILLSRKAGGPDPRAMGSGNPGATNMLRVAGKRLASLTLLGDLLKGLLPVLAGALLGLTLQQQAWLGLAAVIGHLYPLYFRFRGGKGVATLVGAVAAVSPLALVALLATWLLMMLLWGFVGLASIVAACALPLILFAIGAQPQAPLLVFGLLCGALVAYTHRGNLARMRAGTEPRARRLWLLGRLRGQ